jgi:hypothetical protein
MYFENVHILFSDAPIISLGPYNRLAVVENFPLSLTCDVNANPAVRTVQWYKYGVLLPGKPSTHYDLEMQNFFSFLPHGPVRMFDYYKHNVKTYVYRHSV